MCGGIPRSAFQITDPFRVFCPCPKIKESWNDLIIAVSENIQVYFLWLGLKIA
jgi:hypothetical protein